MERDLRDEHVVPGDQADVTLLSDRVASLEATIAALIDRLDTIDVVDVSRGGRPGHDVPANESAGGSRRHLLKLAGAAIVAGGVMSGADETRVSAATNTFMQAGVRHFATEITRLDYGTKPNQPALSLTTEARMMWVDNSNSPTQEGIGIRGDGSPQFGIGIDGVGATGVRGTGSTIPGLGVGVAGNGYYGMSANGTVGMIVGGTNAALELAPSNNTPPPTRAGAVGQIAVDLSSNLWFCVATGTPGRWRKLSGTDTAGSFHAIDPIRSFDSRWSANTRLTNGTSVLVSVADGHDPVGGVTAANVVPVGSTAVAYNVTVTQTAGAGFLSITPGTPTVPTVPATTSSINWSSDGANLANGLVVKLDASRQIRVRCGGGGSTDVVIDVMGYYL